MEKVGFGGFGKTRILECRVRVCRVLKKVWFGPVISCSGLPELITRAHTESKKAQKRPPFIIHNLPVVNFFA